MSMQPAKDAPLADFALFRTGDLDEARERVASVFCPHRLDTIGRGTFDARHHHLAGDRLSLNFIEYGAKTVISPGCLGGFYLFQIPVRGAAAISNGGDSYCSTPGVGAVLNPHLPTSMIWDEGCRQVLLRIERRALSDHLAGLLGSAVDRPLTFAGGFDMTGPRGAALRGLIMHLVAEADAGRPALAPGGLMSRQIEGAIMTGLLEGHRHNYSGFFGQRRSNAAPRHVKLAEDYMLAHLDQPIALEDVAEAVGVSARALQYAFRRFRGTTPMAFLRDTRLRRAHRDLQAGAPGTTVTGVAMRWGFSHFGRFAQSYRGLFGCTPRDTLHHALGDEFVG